MAAIKIMLITILIIPFLYVSGIMASSVKILIPISGKDNHIWMTKVADYGRRLEDASKGIVYMEMNIAQKIIVDISKTRRLS